jgi:hypothetical protein
MDALNALNALAVNLHQAIKRKRLRRVKRKDWHAGLVRCKRCGVFHPLGGPCSTLNGWKPDESNEPDKTLWD